MKTNFFSEKVTFLTIILLFGASRATMSSSYTASTSGNWSSSASWDGNNPGFTIKTGSKVDIPAGITILLDSDLTVQGYLSLDGGCLDLNGQNLTINGAIITTGSGSVIGNRSSDIAFNGYSGAGNLMFSPGNRVIHNLTINIRSNSGVFLGSDLTVAGKLILINGFIGIGDNNLIISEKGTLQGGSSLSYVMNTGTGSLIMAVPNKDAAILFPVGTQNNYAPVAVKNNSVRLADFRVHAIEGVLAEGSTGNNISGSRGMVNTSWNLSSASKGANINLELFWNAGMQVNGFDNTSACISQYTSGGWNTNASAGVIVNSTGLFSLQLDSVTSFGTFAVFDKNSTTAVQDIKTDVFFSIYPNPAADHLNISMAESDKYPLLEIFNAAGNEVIAQQIETPFTSIDINNLAAGVYFASLDKKVTKHFIKK